MTTDITVTVALASAVAALWHQDTVYRKKTSAELDDVRKRLSACEIDRAGLQARAAIEAAKELIDTAKQAAKDLRQTAEEVSLKLKNK